MRQLFLATTVALGFVLAGGPSAQPAHAQTSVVTIQNYAFYPATMTIPVGATVTWMNHDAVAHTTSSDSSVWDSGVLNPGASFSHTFTMPGVFPYHCHIHPFMYGTIIVGSVPWRPHRWCRSSPRPWWSARRHW
jgi:plastocyanin